MVRDFIASKMEIRIKGNGKMRKKMALEL